MRALNPWSVARNKLVDVPLSVIARSAVTKQSISPRKDKNGLLRRCAPLRKRFAFVAGNDEMTDCRGLISCAAFF
jgi:hypothetical protein